MKEINVSGSNRKAIVDDEDYEYVTSYMWSESNERNYILARVNGKTTSLAVHIMNRYNIHGENIDHIDRDGFNNKKSNLRPATVSQNQANSKISKINTSGYKGVWWRKNRNRWIAEIRIGGRKKHLGGFRTKEDAAKAYNKAAFLLFGPYANLNEII